CSWSFLRCGKPRALDGPATVMGITGLSDAAYCRVATDLFLARARHRPQHEMAKCRGNRLVGIVLPSLRLEGDDAPALLDNRDPGEAVERTAGAEVIDGQPDGFRRRRDAELAGNADDRRGFQEGAGHPAVDRGQDRVADDALRERHHEAAVATYADAEEAR